MDSTVEKTASSSFSCDQCDYTYASEKGLRQHKRMKHGKSQLENQLQSSSPSSPKSLRHPTSYSSALAVSPTEDSTRAIPCKNCEEDMSPNHICPTYDCGGCDEVFNTEKHLTNHEWTVHPNMCHICFKFSVDWSSYLTHFHQEHLSNESSV